jgi:nucleotide-binding universal stress UspA family protein
MEEKGRMKILLGYDGSNDSKRALDRAIAFSKNGKAELAIVFQVELDAFETFAAKRLLAEMRDKIVDDAQKLVADAEGTAKQRGVRRVRTLIIEDGDPANAILSVAEKENVDLIVVGRRGLKGFSRFLMGSVSSRVVGHAMCDVLVVK